MNVVPILNNIIRVQSEGEARDLFLFTSWLKKNNRFLNPLIPV